MLRIESRVSQVKAKVPSLSSPEPRNLKREGRSIIHLELGEPDFHPAAPVLDALEKALRAGKDRYCTVSGIPALREELARYLLRTRRIQVDPRNIVMAPGCKLSLFLTLMAIVNPGDEVLYPDPGFPGYASITAGFGGVPVPYELAERNGFQPDPVEIAGRSRGKQKRS